MSDPRSHEPTDPRGALLHPAFLAALAILVINDRVLKGAGVLPGWLTGKLSDVAGLVVAPVVLAALVRARSVRAQVGVHALVALGFALTELSQSTADLVAHALRTIGVSRATLVADASDLWALAVLPLPFALVRRSHAPVSVALPRVSLGAALLACVASPQPRPPSWFTNAYLVNGTDAARDVRLAWTAAVPDCDALFAATSAQPDLARVVDPTIFADGVTFHLDPGETIPLAEAQARNAVGTRRGAADAGFPRDGGGTTSRPDAGGLSGTAACELVLVRSEGASDTIVLIDRGASFTVGTHVGELPEPEHAVALRNGSGVGSFTWVVGSAFRSAVTQEANAPTTCTMDRPAIAYSGGTTSRTASITALDVGPDGCLGALLEDMATHAASNLFVCGVPRDLFPFAMGDTVRVMPGIGALSVTDGTSNGRSIQLSAPTVATVQLGDTTVAVGGAVEACNGERLACGAFVVPAPFTLSPLASGDDPSGIVTHTGATGARTRALVGRAERVLLAMPGCDGGRDVPGPHVQLVVTMDRP